mmetsp:Transcript_163887/g.314826  ORF Transcript_163887/g.314826 Transcript_163887/m.314826 type:complete len:984 (+) Transcript_163887:86-3037(+)
MTSAMVWPTLGSSLKKDMVEDASTTEEENISAAAEESSTSESNCEMPDDFDEEVNTEEQKQEAFRQYCDRFGLDSTGEHFNEKAVKEDAGLDQMKARPIVNTRPVDAALRNSNMKTIAQSKKAGRMTAEDSDGEELTLCVHCQLPIGVKFYTDEDDKPIHAECQSQHMRCIFQKMHESRKLEEAKAKQEARVHYDIGWHAEEVPRNAMPAEELGCYPAPQGMCCLVFDQETHSVHVAPTLEPAQALNLEYLSLSLRVRLREGREPVFSLDPVEASSEYKKDSMQFKRFEPEWLAGTSVGEVMFQADYHLKELSMGEYSQPVIGMKSCFDYSEMEGADKEWSGREWFIVRKADIALTEDSILVPRVKMGVEAREQVLRGDQLIDVKTTRKHHPLVKYADSFTRCFDLIAERKSVVFHLRELAKASVMAKMLIDGGVNMQGPWFDLVGEVKEICPMEVPQLWNDRHYSQIRVKDGVIEEGEEEIVPKQRGIYGGVEFGLDLFDVAFVSVSQSVSGSVQHARREVPVAPAAPAAVVPVDAAPKAKAKPKAKSPGARPAARKGPSKPSSRVALPQVNLEPGSNVPRMKHVTANFIPQGVDLNLDSFNISLLKQVELGGHELISLDSCTSLGIDFWAGLEQGSGCEKDLLRAVFNPHLSDRRDEGDLFVPPDSRPEYVEKLSKLIQGEQLLQRKRRDHFCSEKFATDSPGDLFPASWTSTFAMSCEKTMAKSGESRATGSSLQRRFDYEAESQVFEERLKCTTPTFDKKAEDGTRFRIYNFGSLEVRTLQEHNGEEEVASVFSVKAPAPANSRGISQAIVHESEQIVKVTEYVERARADAQRAGSGNYVFFTVLQTEEGNMISTEVLEFLEGRVTWEENPEDLEDRISLAKVLRKADCQKAGNTVRDMRKNMERASRRMGKAPDQHTCKTYSRATFTRAQAEKVNNSSAQRKPTARVVLSADTMAQLPKALKMEGAKKSKTPDFLLTL